MISKTSSARRVLYLKAKALKEQEKLQARLEKLKREAKLTQKVDLHEEFAREARTAEIERTMAEASSSQGTRFRSILSVDSFTENSGWMDKTETAENRAKSNNAVSVHLTPDNAVKLVHEGKFSAPREDSKPQKKPIIHTEADERAYRKH